MWQRLCANALQAKATKCSKVIMPSLGKGGSRVGTGEWGDRETATEWLVHKRFEGSIRAKSVCRSQEGKKGAALLGL